MKRTLMVLIAISVLLLLYPTAYLFAGSPASTNQLHIMTPNDASSSGPGPGILGHGGNDDEDEDDSKGDADDLAGKRGKGNPLGTSFFGPDPAAKARLAVKIWWMYFFIHRVF